mmetsp:Transcript_74846/g.216358  ORF Transcript_74846/g.216358 Transcript_74846/m.216358 type:complete len:107 (+) Transcript_74846:156-476(+)
MMSLGVDAMLRSMSPASIFLASFSVACLIYLFIATAALAGEVGLRRCWRRRAAVRQRACGLGGIRSSGMDEMHITIPLREDTATCSWSPRTPAGTPRKGRPPHLPF